jgi:HTH-type transcriptional regulator/antitoxin HigA
MTKSKTRGGFKNGIPDTYTNLFMEHAIRPIHDSVGHANSLEVIRALAGLDLNEDQADYFEALAIFVNEYEAKNMETLPSATPLEVLRYLVEENGVSGRELSRILGKDESLGAKILSGKRGITVDHAKKLAERFNVKVTAFLDV